MIPKLSRVFGYILTETPYNENWVSAIKYVIPNDHREWNKKGKVWFIGVSYYEAVKEITEYFFGHVIDATGGMQNVRQAVGWKTKFEEWCLHENGSHKQKKGKSPFEVLQIAENASPSVIKAVSRQLLNDNHPDNGGKKEAFQEITEAVDKLKAMGRL
jgi:hypothetical protein